jgi:RNA polymerase sigma factor (sigma-70 family)
LQTAVNHVFDHYRKHARLTSLDDRLDPAAEDPGIQEVVEARSSEQILLAVRALIDRQKPRRRAVAILWLDEERTYEEIGQILGITPSTVRTHVERLRTLLRPFRDQFDDLTGGGERR